MTPAAILAYGLLATTIIGLTLIGILNQRTVNRRRAELEGRCGDSDGRSYGAREDKPR